MFRAESADSDQGISVASDDGAHDASVASGDSSPADLEESEPELLGEAEMILQLQAMKQEAYQACLAEVEAHLDTFLQGNPQATYEEWIAEIHPENMRTNTNDGEIPIDHRFYMEASDHRLLWNARVDVDRHVRV